MGGISKRKPVKSTPARGAGAATGAVRASFRHERRLHRTGLRLVAGIDEAGRGPLAGPVFAAAVVLDPECLPKGVADSKTLDPAVRSRLFADICSCAVAIGVGSASAEEIDRINIRQATFLAMRRALRSLPHCPDHALIDGRDIPPGLACPAEAIVGGDAACLSIAAASIIAKVLRDRVMHALDTHYPVYGFASHAGYATKHHRMALGAHGPSPFHRMSFGSLKNG